MKPKISNLIDHLFRMERINGGYRWRLTRIGWLGIYLHHFDDDWVGAMHDHPYRIVSIGLLGKYKEETPSGARIHRAPWVRSFPALHIHRIVMVDGGSCWTIMIALKPVRTWGFYTSAGWMPWHKYANTDMSKTIAIPSKPAI